MFNPCIPQNNVSNILSDTIDRPSAVLDFNGRTAKLDFLASRNVLNVSSVVKANTSVSTRKMLDRSMFHGVRGSSSHVDDSNFRITRSTHIQLPIQI